MCVDFGAGGARHVGDQVGEVGGRLEFDFAVRGGGGAGSGKGVGFVDCGSCHIGWLSEVVWCGAFVDGDSRCLQARVNRPAWGSGMKTALI